jgi:hypothetical protein
MKSLLRQKPILRSPDYDVLATQPLILNVDASPIGIGAVLQQESKDGKRFVCRYYSKALNLTQRLYPQIKRELFGVFSALKHMKHFVYGQYFILEIDCLLLIGLIRNPDFIDATLLR